MRKYLILISLLTVVACGKSNNKEITVDLNSRTVAKSEVVCEIDESSCLLDERIRGLEFMSDSVFVISNNIQASIYNTKGERLKNIGRKGRAKGEFVSAGQIDIKDNFIYIWCTSTVRLLKYDFAGKFVEQYSGFTNAITSFEVIGDDVYFHGLGKGKLFNIFNLKTKETNDNFKEMSDSNEILLVNGMTECIANIDNGIIYVDPTTLTLYTLKSDKKEMMFKLIDKGYISEPNVSEEDIMQPPYDKAIKYITENSTVIGVHAFNDNIYIISENYDKDSTNELVKKKLVIYIVSEKTKEVKSATLKYPTNSFIKRICFNKDNIYYLSTTIEEGKTFLNKINY